MDKKNDWVSITAEGFWEDTTGQSLLSQSERNSFVDGIFEAAKDAAEELIEKHPK